MVAKFNKKMSKKKGKVGIVDGKKGSKPYFPS
jgi:hypothetical protein